VRIDNTKVYLKTGDQVKELELYVKTPAPGTPAQAVQQSPNRIKQTLSRSEMQQRIQNNMDTMLQGLRAGPFLVNGKIDGFKLFLETAENEKEVIRLTALKNCIICGLT